MILLNKDANRSIVLPWINCDGCVGLRGEFSYRVKRLHHPTSSLE